MYQPRSMLGSCASITQVDPFMHVCCVDIVETKGGRCEVTLTLIFDSDVCGNYEEIQGSHWREWDH